MEDIYILGKIIGYKYKYKCNSSIEDKDESNNEKSLNEIYIILRIPVLADTNGLFIRGKQKGQSIKIYIDINTDTDKQSQSNCFNILQQNQKYKFSGPKGSYRLNLIKSKTFLDIFLKVNIKLNVEKQEKVQINWKKNENNDNYVLSSITRYFPSGI
jgi:hypothetical protein